MVRQMDIIHLTIRVLCLHHRLSHTLLTAPRRLLTTQILARHNLIGKMGMWRNRILPTIPRKLLMSIQLSTMYTTSTTAATHPKSQRNRLLLRAEKKKSKQRCLISTVLRQVKLLACTSASKQTRNMPTVQSQTVPLHRRHKMSIQVCNRCLCKRSNPTCISRKRQQPRSQNFET